MKTYIKHLDKMSPREFLDLVRYLDTEYGGVLCRDEIDITEKVDGSAWNVHMSYGTPMAFQTATSPPYCTVGEFRQRSVDKGYEPWLGEQFDALMYTMKKDRRFNFVCPSNWNLTIKGEILYPPLGEDQGDKIKFVRIPYDKDKLGTDYTYVIFGVYDDDGERWQFEDDFLDVLECISDDKRKYVRPKIDLIGDIELRDILAHIKSYIIDPYHNVNLLLKSRKKENQELKEKVKFDIRWAQKLVSDRIMGFVGDGSFGPDIEGIVIKFKNGNSVKIVTDEFKNARSVV